MIPNEIKELIQSSTAMVDQIEDTGCWQRECELVRKVLSLLKHGEVFTQRTSNGKWETDSIGGHYVDRIRHFNPEGKRTKMRLAVKLTMPWSGCEFPIEDHERLQLEVENDEANRFAV